MTLLAVEREGRGDRERERELKLNHVLLERTANFVLCKIHGVINDMTIFTAPPKPPKILRGASIVLRAGETVSLTCESLGGKPAAELTWLDADNNVVRTGESLPSTRIDHRQV